MTGHKLRPYLPSDAEACHEIFLAAIEELTADDYDEDTRAAWAEAGGDTEAFGRRLARMLTLLVVEEGVPIGFASLEDKRVVAMLYVHPDRIGEGVATTLADALIKLAAAAGSPELTVEASDTAHDFFASRGFEPQRRLTKALGDVWISNTLMTKKLSPAPTQAPQ